MRRRTRYSLTGVGVFLALLAIAIFLRKEAPPECARLLPESDAIVYFNLKPIRLVTHFDKTPVVRDPELQKFMDATGIVFERDLDRAAFGLHRMPDPKGPNGPVAYSEVFEGRVDGHRLTAYLGSVASSTETYAGHEIFNIPLEGRTLRVAMLGYDMVAASNAPTTEQIHSILDRYRAAASPFSGSSLLAAHYSDVPLLSEAWGIGKVGLPFSENGKLKLLGLTLPIAADTTFVASVRYLHALHLRVEEIAPNDAQAADEAAALGQILTLVKGLEQNAGQQQSPQDVAANRLIESLKVEQVHNRTVVTGVVPPEMFKSVEAIPEAQAAGK